MIERKWTNVSSSAIKAIDYDEPTQTLTVIFRNDQVYQYHEVNRDMYREVIKAPSIGKYFNNVIRYRPNEKVELH